ncbi:MAG TPA: aspartate kinase [Bacteroidales bacterium]|nr:aspartate kinase [Bacteroidales bacterium]
MLVYKFGGASVKDSDGIRNLGSIVSGCAELLCVVVSAMGKTTNALEFVVDEVLDNRLTNALDKLEELVISCHRLAISELNLPAETLDSEFEALRTAVTEADRSRGDGYDKIYDGIVSYGEILSSSLVCAYLDSIGVDAEWIDMRRMLVTDSNYREANVVLRESERRLRTGIDGRHRVYVLQGFIGANSEGHATTLGREGSDYSAALVGNMLNADSVTIWKDVKGILNADPRVFHDATLIKELTYYDAVELAYGGAQVIHPKTIRPLENKSIPLYVRPYEQPSFPGSKICAESTAGIDIPVIIVRHNVVLISIGTLDFSFVMEGGMQGIFAILERYRLKVSMIECSAVRVSVVVDNNRNLNDAIEALRANYRVSYNDGLTLLTIRQTNDETERRIGAFRDTLMVQRTRKTVKILFK